MLHPVAVLTSPGPSLGVDKLRFSLKGLDARIGVASEVLLAVERRRSLASDRPRHCTTRRRRTRVSAQASPTRAGSLGALTVLVPRHLGRPERLVKAQAVQAIEVVVGAPPPSATPASARRRVRFVGLATRAGDLRMGGTQSEHQDQSCTPPRVGWPVGSAKSRVLT
jgi:hypothetical protein